MADIFLSYTRVDQARARRFSKALESRGWSVWWDPRIPPGRDFNAYIEQQLSTARCIVVLWSRTSVASRFVRDEAAEGLSDGRLVPALIDRDIKQPMGFRQTQAADLSDWDGQQPHDEFERFVSSIEAIVASSTLPTTRIRRPPISTTPDRAPGPDSRFAQVGRSDEREVREPPAAMPPLAGRMADVAGRQRKKSGIIAAALAVFLLLLTGGWVARGVTWRSGNREARTAVPLAGRALDPVGRLVTPAGPVNRRGLEQASLLTAAAAAVAESGFDEAIRLYQQVLDVEPDDAVAKAGLNRARAGQRSAGQRSAGKQGVGQQSAGPQSARNRVEDPIAKEQDGKAPPVQAEPETQPPVVPDPRRAELLKQAHALLETRFFDAAIARFDEMLAADPSDSDAKAGRANAVALKNQSKP